MSNRNDYRTWSATEVSTDTDATWNRMLFNGVPISRLIDSATNQPVALLRLTYALAIERLGLRLAVADITYSLDADGSPIVDPKGKPVEESRSIPAHDLSINVKSEAYVDSYETPIPKGKQYFVADLQPGNRPVNETNVKDLAKRLDRWMLTGDTLVKDNAGSGQNEQHRCWSIVYDKLTGANLAPPEGIPVISIDGVSRGASGAIDTGKQKNATDDFGSDPNLLPNPLTLMDYRSGDNIGYGEEAKQARVKILREMQGTCKRLLLRMLGSNIKASKFSGYESSGNAMLIAERWVGLDELVNMAYAFITGISVNQPDNKKQKMRPCSTWEVATAYSLWLLRNSEQLQSAEALADYQFPAIDLDPLKEFLVDLEDGATQAKGPLADWARDRVTPATLKASDESSFAQVLLAMRDYFAGNAVTAELNRSTKTGKEKESGSKFTSLGGGDRGPIPKKAKE